MTPWKIAIYYCLAFMIPIIAGNQVAAGDAMHKGDGGADAYTLFGRQFDFNGFVQQEAALGIDPKFCGKNVTDYSTVQFEWSYHMTESLAVYGINRLLGDMAYTAQSGKRWFNEANSTVAQHSRARHKLQWEWNTYDREGEFIRELYLDIQTRQINFRLGKQQVVWGESDGLRLMDFINPQDLRREWVLRDSDEGYESTRIPLWLIKASYFPDIKPFAIEDLQFELIWNPGKSQSNRLEAYEADGGVWATDEPNLPFRARVNLADKHSGGIRARNMEYALRVMGNLQEWLFTLNFYYGMQHDFVLKPTRPSVVLPPWDRALLQLNFEKEYGWRRIIGFTVNKDVNILKQVTGGPTAPTMRIEALYEFKKPFQNEGSSVGAMAWTGLNPWETKYKKEKDQLRCMAGFDWPVYIRWLNPRESIFLSTQVFIYYIKDVHGQLVNAPFYFNDGVSQDPLPPLPYQRSSRIDPWRIHQTQKYFSFLCNTLYDNKRIIPQFLFLYDWEENSYAIKTKVTFAYGSHWRPELGLMYFHGDHDTGKSMGLFQKNSQAYVKIKYQF